MSKKGRKPTTWKHPDTGETINGLSLRTKRGQKRFFSTGKDAPCFGSVDEWQAALFNFKIWKAKKSENETHLIIGDAAHLKLSDELEYEGQSNIPIVLESIAPLVGKMILANPRQAAITFQCPPLERLADLDTLPEPAPDISLDEVGELYFNKKPPLGDYELRHSQKRWKQFREITKTKSAKELTQEDIDHYSTAIYNQYETHQRSPSYVSKRFSSIKTIFN